jgi:hypothetical protein
MVYTASYRRASQILAAGGLLHVFLAAMERRAAPKPWLFHGRLAEPVLFRDCLLTLRDVVNARFYRPDLWRLLDPVVTVEPEWVRLECFSSDGGVYARADLAPAAFAQGEIGSPGTTNVDFGPEFAARLSLLRDGRPSAFEVGEESVTLHIESGSTRERQVDLPERWVRGFLQVQAIQRAATPMFALDAVRARQALHRVPAQRRSGEAMHVTPDGVLSSLRPGGAPAALAVEGIHRLRLLRRLVPHARGLGVWAVGDGGPSFWGVDLGAARFTFGISSAVNRGFSGDGEALKSARPAMDEALVERARAAVAGGASATLPQLARALGVGESTAGALVDLLSEQGLVGYDLPAGRFYPRHLPFVPDTGFTLQPRDRNAQRLAAAERVEVEERAVVTTGLRLAGWVEGDQATYYATVQLSPGGEIVAGDCTCPWILQHGMERGPCKHILALRLAGERDE